MPKGYPIAACRHCERPISRRDELSRSGLCAECGPLLQREATLQLVNHRGPYFEHWRRKCAEAFRYVLSDTTPTGR